MQTDVSGIAFAARLFYAGAEGEGRMPGPFPEPETFRARLDRIVETLDERLKALGFSEEDIAEIKRQAEQMGDEGQA